jgi:hypothetical protein
MSYTKRIVCLANSLKLGERCVAGKEIQKDSFGEWIRPIGSTETGELSPEQIECQDGGIPRLLDIITIPFKAYKPHMFQTENHLIDENKRWIREQPIGQKELPLLIDKVDRLWLNGFHSANDRIPLTTAEQKITSSLLFIKPRRLVLKVASGVRGRQVRASFEYNGIDYSLGVTDLIVKNVLLKRNDGDYPVNSNDIYLCTSLGEPFHGYTYKLVAAVINFPLK